MKIERITGGLLSENGYLIYEEAGDCYIIDPGSSPRNFVDFVKKHKLNLKGIILTHHHPDHVGGVTKIKGATGCPVFIHRLDGDMYRFDADEFMEDGNIFKIGDTLLRVYNTPGHTKGSICLYCEKYKCVFTGDTIFDVDIGRTDLQDGSDIEMNKSIKNVVDKWSNEIVIYPGHGTSQNMKYVRKNNREFIDIVNE